MSKKKRRAIKNRMLQDIRVTEVIKDLKLPDLQRECVIRGMIFQDVCNSSIPQLHSYLVKYWDGPVDKSQIAEYDAWTDQELRNRGREDLIHPLLSLGQSQNKETGEPIKKRVKLIKKVKIKKNKAKTIDGIFQGTKKAYTYELAKQGIEKAKAIDMVKEKFPEANEKSVSIWYNKAKKLG